MLIFNVLYVEKYKMVIYTKLRSKALQETSLSRRIKMKKRLLSIMLTVIMGATLLVGCGGNSSKGSVQPKQNQGN